MRQRFNGNGTHKVDDKGRISIPAEFRRVLDALDPHRDPDTQPRVHVLYGDRRDPWLTCYSIAAMDDVAATLDEMEEAGEDISTFQTYYFGYAEVVSLDPTGRMVLSKRLREKAGIDQAVSYMGLGKTFRLSSPDAPEAATDPLSRVVETLPDDVSIPKLLAQSRRRLREGS